MKNNPVELVEVKILIIEINSLPGLNNWKACWETGKDIWGKYPDCIPEWERNGKCYRMELESLIHGREELQNDKIDFSR